MVNRIRTGDPRWFNKGRSSKFRVGSQVQQTPEEGRRTYRPKYCGNKNKDGDNSPKTLNDKNHQASSQKFRQLLIILLKNYSFVYAQLNDSKNCNVSQTIQLNIRNLFTQLNEQTFVFQSIQFSISQLFALSLNDK